MYFERPPNHDIVEDAFERTLHVQKSSILSKAFIKFKKVFKVFLQTSTIHGLNHLVAIGRHPFEIILWLTTVLISVYGILQLSSTTWTRYQSSPTVVSMDRDMYAWNTTFPAVTVCPDIRLDEEKLDSYVSDSPEPNKKLLKEFLVSLSNATYGNFKSLPDYKGVAPNNFMNVLLNLSTNFQPIISMGVSGIILDFVPTITEMGLCYGVNSKVAIYNSPEYRLANRSDLIKTKSKTLTIHPFDGEVLAQVQNISTAYKVYIHGPEEFPDISTKYQTSVMGYYLKSYVTAFTVYTSPAASKLSINQRRCRFPHENNLQHNSIYTYTMCRIECRIKLCLKYCNCIPHFYRNIGDEKICDVKGLKCLANYQDVLYRLIRRDGTKIDCKCFPLCDDVNYILQSHKLEKWSSTNFQWGLVMYPKKRYRRDVIYGFTDVLVSLGSMAGLFLGCSVLSFTEILYYVTFGLILTLIFKLKHNIRSCLTVN